MTDPKESVLNDFEAGEDENKVAATNQINYGNRLELRIPEIFIQGSKFLHSQGIESQPSSNQQGKRHHSLFAGFEGAIHENWMQIQKRDLSPDSLTTTQTMSRSSPTSGQVVVKPHNSSFSGPVRGRRESFIYRDVKLPDKIVGSKLGTELVPRHSTITHGEDIIVTPYAQILATLQNVRNSFVVLDKLPSDTDRKLSHSPVTVNSMADSNCETEKNHGGSNELAADTLRDLDWCLNQLENLHTHRSVSELAKTKFKKMMNDELSHISASDKEGTEVTKYLTTNFMDKDREEFIESPLEEVDTHQNTSPNLSSVGSKIEKLSLIHENDDNKEPDSLFKDASDITPPPPKSANQIGCTCAKRNHNYFFDKSLPTFIHHSIDDNNLDSESFHTQDMPHRHSSFHSLSSRSLSPRGVSKTLNVISSIMGFNPICIHIHSFTNGIPKYGIFVKDEAALQKELDQIDTWGMDIFKLHQVSEHRPLTCLTYCIMKKRNLINHFDIPEDNLINFLMCIEDHYLDIPYHNRLHATDVTQSSNYLLSSPGFQNVFNEMEQLAIILASAIHDVDHPGFTNQFLINSCSDLAIIYNDESVLENHHLAIAFKILHEPKCNIFINFPNKKKQIIRRLIIDLVLATDMSKHMKLLADLKTMVETKKIAGTCESLLDYAERNRVLQAMIHCGDLSNPTKPLNIYLRWTNLIMEEYFMQGEKEKQCGLAMSPMCDRENSSIEKSQIGFMDYIVQPLWETWADLVHPDGKIMLNNMENNREYFEKILQEKR